MFQVALNSRISDQCHESETMNATKLIQYLKSVNHHRKGLLVSQ